MYVWGWRCCSYCNFFLKVKCFIYVNFQVWSLYKVFRQDVVCTNDLTVSVYWSKTIQYGQRQMCVPNTLCNCCLRLCMVPAPRDFPTCRYLNSHGHSTPLTYSVFASQVTWLTHIGVLNVNHYCTHSFHWGSATFAFHFGVNSTLIQTQGVTYST